LSDLTPEAASAVLDAAMAGGMYPNGAAPDGDDAKVTEAKKVLQLAQRSKELVDASGADSIPLWGVTKRILVAAGEISEGYVPGQAAQPPVAQQPPQPPAQPQQQVVPEASPPLPDKGPEGNEVWLDSENEQWVVLNDYGGGPQVHVRSVATGEQTVLPVGFLKQLSPDQSAAHPAPAQAPAPIPPGQQRLYGDVVYTLESDDGVKQVVILDPQGSRYTQDRAGWLTWPLVQSPPPPAAAAPSPPADPPLPPVPSVEAAQPVEQPQVPEQPSETSVEPSAPDEPPARHDDQMLAIPVDDDEGDEEYAKVLDKVVAIYDRGASMPAPMDLERPPSRMPEDLTETSDIQARQLHSQFNALAARARYLMGVEQAKSRACEQVYKHHLKKMMPDVRKQLGAGASVTEVQQQAEEDPCVEPWLRRRVHHHERAEAYKTFLSIYSENVTVLSRDWTMRDQEEKQA
jgi:hypothetical protein